MKTVPELKKELDEVRQRNTGVCMLSEELKKAIEWILQEITKREKNG